MQITIIGVGYVGLVQAVGLADFGFNVTCIEKDKEKLRELKFGRVPFYEPDLEDLLRKNLKRNRLNFTDNYLDNIAQSDVIFICVGTPPKKNGESDLRFVDQVSKEISNKIKGYTVIVSKSTVPVGTSRRIENILKKKNSLKSFDVVSNPEFLREGSALEDFIRPDKVIIGCRTIKAEKILKKIYKPLNRPYVVTNNETAEVIKYANNSFLATKITFINEIADLCENIDAEVETVAKAIGLDGRIGPKFLHPGPGYGGSCFPKDVKSLIYQGKKNSIDLKIVKAVDKANELRIKFLVKRIKKILNNKFNNIQIGILGISFKPNTDDIRKSPGIKLVRDLSKTKAKIKVYDPQAMKNAKKELNKTIEFCSNEYEVAKNSNLLVIVTEWNQFKNLNLFKIKKIMKKPMILDLRNIYSKEIEKNGFYYYSIGNN
ncbi:MAG: UDP-glucose 6-dehydrogenase [Alphaproteobacteria bacterium MarineAlpha6_Bin6]|nr:MAG: UDP-glucose 6-dehydrogenase [Alphaproteobacteria bacterium MarineAlpha6_Bin6]PPR33910.1 MAG: UDP-glucose 6-dehydrogenase [Alphaproteobacteria bacterium MarineAlpha6_Bin5]|tara:strand:+ start:2034 stop:3326 length:1293 start_codon:yes stop_codon:yes gene_type:complete